jgi:hypothetical protein
VSNNKSGCLHRHNTATAHWSVLKVFIRTPIEENRSDSERIVSAMSTVAMTPEQQSQLQVGPDGALSDDIREYS